MTPKNDDPKRDFIAVARAAKHGAPTVAAPAASSAA